MITDDDNDRALTVSQHCHYLLRYYIASHNIAEWRWFTANYSVQYFTVQMLFTAWRRRVGRGKRRRGRRMRRRRKSGHGRVGKGTDRNQMSVSL